MRIAGLATGMDINQMVSDLMRAQRLPIDKMMQDRQIIQWQMEDYREINRKLNTFHTNIFDTIMRSSNMLSKNVSSSNSNFVTATAASNVGNMTLQISNVTSLATAASNSSTGAISGATKIDPAVSLTDQSFEDESVWKAGIMNQQNIAGNGTTTVSINSDKDIINAEDAIVIVNGKAYDVVTDPAIVLDDNKVYFDASAKTLEFKSDISTEATVSTTFFTEATDPDNPAQQYSSGSITTYNEGKMQSEAFVFTRNQTLNQILNSINQSSVGVNSFYDDFKDKVTFARDKTGIHNESGSEMIFKGDFFTKALKMDNTKEIPPTNATLTINGLDTERRTNTFTVGGMTVNLKDKFTNAVTLSASTNTDKTFETIKAFVDEYNELLEFTNGKLTEERYRDYRPLTDEQKDAMSEKDVERWEERARSGLLRNDSTLGNHFNRMRTDMYSPVSGALDTAFNQLSAIGITTTSNYMDRGKLEINEEKLRQAIEQDPEGVFQLFTADGASFSEKGIARRIRETVDSTITSLAERAGGFRGKVQNNQFTLGRNLDSINDRISNFERRLQQVEDRYWRQFNAMDAAVNQANQQAETLFAQLFGNQG